MKQFILVLSLALGVSGCVHAPLPKVPTAPAVGFGGVDAGFGSTTPVKPATGKTPMRMMLAGPSYPACVPVNGVQCTTNYNLWLPPHGYPNWDVPMNANSQIIDAAIKSGGGGSGKPCVLTPNSLQFNLAGSFGCTTPTYDPVANAFNALNQFSNNNQVTQHPNLYGNNNFGPVASAFFSNTYTAPFPVDQSYESMAIYAARLAGGQNIQAFKPGITAFSVTATSASGGSVFATGDVVSQSGLGESFNYYHLNYCSGGTSASGDEGCNNGDEETFQSNGTYGGPITAGGSPGSTSITVAPTHGAPFPDPQGHLTGGYQGAGGRIIIDVTQAYTTGTITGITRPSSTYSTYTGSGTGWTVDTINTTLGTAVVFSGTNQPQSFTVTPASMAGITTSSKLCITDQTGQQMVQPSATTGTTFTATFIRPQFSTAFVTGGGECGHYIGIDADTVPYTPGYTSNILYYVFPIIRATSSTSIDVLVTHAGNWNTYPGAFSAADGTYTIFPGAEVADITNGTGYESNTLTLQTNTMSAANGDVIDEPDWPDLTQGGGLTLVSRVLPCLGNCYGKDYTFQGAFASNLGGSAWALGFNNQTTASYYNAPNRFAPNLFFIGGVWGSGFSFENAPTSVTRIGDCNLVSGCGNVNIESISGTNGGDNYYYSQVDGSRDWSVGFSHHHFHLDAGLDMTGVVNQTNTGNFVNSGNVAVGGSISSPNGTMGTATNLILYSGFPSGTTSPWVTAGNVSLSSVTPNAALDPSGATTAETAVTGALSGTQSAGQAQTLAMTIGQTYTYTQCMRGHAGGEVVEFGAYAWGGGVVDRVVTLTTSMVCYSVSGVSTVSSGQWGWVFYGNTSGATIDVAWAQVEQSPLHGAYVTTAGTALSVVGIVGNNAFLSSIVNASLLQGNALGEIAPAQGPARFGTTYTAAGTALPACASATKGAIALVGDATSVTPGTAYTTGGGTITINVQCTYDSSGPTYAWQTM